jgi:hypothetical protein
MVSRGIKPLKQLGSAQEAQIIAVSRGAVVIWDFDGVIADTEPLHADSYRVLLGEMGNAIDQFAFERYIGHTELEIWSMLVRDGYNLKLPVEKAVEARADVFMREALIQLEPTWIFNSVSALVRPVGKRQVVVSNGNPKIIQELLQKWELTFLEQLLPHDFPTGKRGLLNELWRSGSTVTIEDSELYLRLAGEAGSWRIAVHHSYNSTVHLDGELQVRI